MDVHKDTVVACVRHHDGGKRGRQEVRTFATYTRALEDLARWLASEGVTHAAMESTGVYWKPVFNILEGRVTVLLVNAQHIKQVPGRKTDVADCAWIAQLLQHGLLRASFIPPARQRELRDLTRQRSQMGAEQTAVANRIQKVLEDANVKLASVASDVLGVSGRAMLDAIVAGQEDPEALADLARRRMRGKIPQLRDALRGRVTDHHRFLLRLLLEHLDYLGRLIARLDARIEQLAAPDAEALALLTTIPGIKQHTAEVLLAEVGPSVDPFPTAGQFASWPPCPSLPPGRPARPDGRPERVLVVLAPLPAVMVERHLRRVPDQLRQRLDRAAGPPVPVARQHPVRERVPAGVARVTRPPRVLIPAQLPLQPQEPGHASYLLPRPAAPVAEERRARVGRRLGQ